MDAQGVDAVVFPGQLSDIHLNDSIQPSFGRRDPQASAAGVPTVIFPAGVNDHGQPINLQLQGKAFDDVKLLGLRVRVRGQGQRARRSRRRRAGAAVRDDRRPAPSAASVPATLSLTLGAPASFGAFTPGVAKDYTAATTRQRHLAPPATRR